MVERDERDQAIVVEYNVRGSGLGWGGGGVKAVPGECGSSCCETSLLGSETVVGCRSWPVCNPISHNDILPFYSNSNRLLPVLTKGQFFSQHF